MNYGSIIFFKSTYTCSNYLYIQASGNVGLICNCQMVLYSLIFRAHSRFTHCLMTQGFQLHLDSSLSFLRVDHGSVWSGFMWCAVLICSQKIQMAW